MPKIELWPTQQASQDFVKTNIKLKRRLAKKFKKMSYAQRLVYWFVVTKIKPIDSAERLAKHISQAEELVQKIATESIGIVAKTFHELAERYGITEQYKKSNNHSIEVKAENIEEIERSLNEMFGNIGIKIEVSMKEERSKENEPAK